MADDPVELLARHAAAGRPCALATVVSCEAPTSARPGDKAVITADGRLVGWVGGSCSEPVVRREALRALAEGTARLVRIVAGEPVGETRRPGELTLATTPGTDVWAVVATMGHYDEDALEAALAHPGIDVSLVASARRTAAVVEALRGRGLDEAALARVRAPAGEVRGGGQEEIALLALAGVVVRRRARTAPADPEPAAFATDPVCGMVVDVAGATWREAHGGRTVFFCARGCRDRFREDPDRYPAPETAR